MFSVSGVRTSPTQGYTNPSAAPVSAPPPPPEVAPAEPVSQPWAAEDSFSAAPESAPVDLAGGGVSGVAPSGSPLMRVGPTGALVPAADSGVTSATAPVAGGRAGPAVVPQTDLYSDGGYTEQPGVADLQNALVQTGHMSQADMDAGPGYYGPRTVQGVASLEAEYGLPVDGTTYDAATRDALTQELAGSVPAPSEPVPAQSGELYPVPYISQMSSAGTEDDWNALSNCGPATLAMIGKGFGLGTEYSDGGYVNHLAGLEGIGEPGTTVEQMASMGAQAGLTPETHWGSDTAWVDQQLAAGKLVALNGDRAVTLQNEQPPYASGTADGGHWIAVTGKTAEGNYIVKDPSTTVTELTPEELSRYLYTHGHGGAGVSFYPSSWA